MSEELSALIARRDELQAELETVESLIAEKQAQARLDVIAQIRSIMSEAGLTLADLGGSNLQRTAHSSPVAKVRRVEPKYRNPSTGETWTGRGLKPRWLSEALAAGKSIEEFLIQK